MEMAKQHLIPFDEQLSFRLWARKMKLHHEICWVMLPRSTSPDSCDSCLLFAAFEVNLFCSDLLSKPAANLCWRWIRGVSIASTCERTPIQLNGNQLSPIFLIMSELISEEADSITIANIAVQWLLVVGVEVVEIVGRNSPDLIS